MCLLRSFAVPVPLTQTFCGILSLNRSLGAETPAWLATNGLEILLAEENKGADPYKLLRPGSFWHDKEEEDWAGSQA